MKININLLVIFLLLLSFYNLKAQSGLQDVACIGYNQDVVADDATTALGSTTTGVDYATGHVFIANNFNPGAGVCATTNTWPLGNVVNSITTSGLTYNLQNPGTFNVLLIPSGSSGALTVINPVAVTSLYLLANGGGAACTVSATITFADASTQVVSCSVPDWCSGISPATEHFYRKVRDTASSCSTSNIDLCQYMYDITLAINVANQSKAVTSISFNNTGGNLCIYAVGGFVLAPCATPTASPTSLNLTPGSFTVSGSFTASANTDHYLIVRSTYDTLNTLPVDGTNYITGALLGSATVVSYQTGTTFTDAGLNPNTQYYYYVFASNASCVGNSPVYLTTPLTNSTTTLTPLNGIYTINSLQATVGTNYNSFTEAVNALNLLGISGSVTFNVAAGQSWTVTCPVTPNNYGYKITTTGTASMPIIFRNDGTGINPVLYINGIISTNDKGIWLSACNYVTFDGIDIQDSVISLEYGYYLAGTATSGCSYNTIKNCNITLGNTTANTNTTGIYLVSTATSSAGTNSHNKFYNNNINHVFYGIKLIGTATYFDERNEVGTENGGRNLIKNIGYAGVYTANGINHLYQDSLQIFNTAIDSIRSTLGSANSLVGIQAGVSSNFNYYGDTVRNVIGSENYGFNFSGTTSGINNIHNCVIRDFYATSGNINLCRVVAADTTLYFYNNEFFNINTTGGGIEGFYTNSSGKYNIYNNKFYNFNSTYTSLVQAYALLNANTNAYVYNNFISDLNCPGGITIPSTDGISIGTGTTARLYYNTIYLKYTSTNATNSSTCIYAAATPSSLDIRNNIFINKCDMTTGTRASALWWASTTYTNIATTTNNNLYYAGTPSAKNVIFYNGTTGYQTLDTYQALVSPKDAISFTEDVPFINTTTKPYNLHINPSIETYAESNGQRITTPFTITSDIDGDIRWGETGYTGTGSSTDLGADEFNGISYPPCAAPSNQPTNLILTLGNATISGSFTASTGTPAADHYLIVRSTSSTLTTSPVTGISYPAGSSFAGGTIVAYQTATTFVDNGPLASGTYYYFIFAANSLACTIAPAYKTTSPLTANAIIKHDVSISRIITPIDPISVAGNQTVSVKIKNLGTTPEVSIPVYYQVNTLTPVTQTWSGTLAHGDSVTYNFTTTFAIPAVSPFTLCAYTKLTTDQDTTNDKICNTIHSVVGINENSLSDANIMLSPNPAHDKLNIKCNNIKMGKTNFTIYDLQGKKLYTEEIVITTNSYNKDLNVNQLKAGVYFLKIENESGIINNKFIIE